MEKPAKKRYRRKGIGVGNLATTAIGHERTEKSTEAFKESGTYADDRVAANEGPPTDLGIWLGRKLPS